MSPLRRRFSSFMVFSITILLTLGISTALYYFKIERNETRQNQLHFRELNKTGKDIVDRIETLKTASVPNTGTLVITMDKLLNTGENIRQNIQLALKPQAEKYLHNDSELSQPNLSPDLLMMQILQLKFAIERAQQNALAELGSLKDSEALKNNTQMSIALASELDQINQAITSLQDKKQSTLQKIKSDFSLWALSVIFELSESDEQALLRFCGVQSEQEDFCASITDFYQWLRGEKNEWENGIDNFDFGFLIQEIERISLKNNQASLFANKRIDSIEEKYNANKKFIAEHKESLIIHFTSIVTYLKNNNGADAGSKKQEKPKDYDFKGSCTTHLEKICDHIGKLEKEVYAAVSDDNKKDEKKIDQGKIAENIKLALSSIEEKIQGSQLEINFLKSAIRTISNFQTDLVLVKKTISYKGDSVTNSTPSEVEAFYTQQANQPKYRGENDELIELNGDNGLRAKDFFSLLAQFVALGNQLSEKEDEKRGTQLEITSNKTNKQNLSNQLGAELKLINQRIQALAQDSDKLAEITSLSIATPTDRNDWDKLVALFHSESLKLQTQKLIPYKKEEFGWIKPWNSMTLEDFLSFEKNTYVDFNDSLHRLISLDRTLSIDLSLVKNNPAFKNIKRIPLKKGKNNEAIGIVEHSVRFPITLNTSYICKKYLDQSKPCWLKQLGFALALPLADLIVSNQQRFSLLTLVDEKGEIQATKYYEDIDVVAAGLELADLKPAFKQLQKQLTHSGTASKKDCAECKASKDTLHIHTADQEQALSVSKHQKQASTPSYSTMLDKEIGGEAFRLYFQPLPNSPQLSELTGQQLYLVGLIASSELQKRKLSVSPNLALWFVIVLIVLIALTPALKVRFVSNKYAFSRADISQFIVGIMAAAGVLAIALNDHWFFSYFLEHKRQQASQLHRQIQHDFSQELKALLEFKKDYAVLNSECETSNASSDILERSVLGVPRGSIELKSCEDKEDLILKRSDGKGEYIVEGAFTLNHEGYLVDKSVSRWINDKLYLKRDVDLSHRQYFKDAIDCQLWGMGDEPGKCAEGFTFERIHNVRDSRKTSQFAFSLFESASKTEFNNRKIFSFSTRLRTFFQRPLPRGFGYMVVGDDGMTWFHSDDERSLVENAFVETDNNQQLRQFIGNRSQLHDRVQFDSLYQGESHQFTVGALLDQQMEDQQNAQTGERKHSNFNDVPLTLIVFYRASDAQMNNMLLVFLAIILYLSLMFLVYLGFRFIAPLRSLAQVVYYDSAKQHVYWKWAFLLVGASVFVLFSFGVVSTLLDRLLLWSAAFTALTIGFCIQSKVTNWAKCRLVLPALLLVSLFVILFLFSGRQPVYLAPNWIANLFFAGGIGALLLVFLNLWFGKKILGFNWGQRFNLSYVMYLFGLLLVAAIVPANIMVNSANGYLLQRQADLERLHLNQSQSTYEKEWTQYLSLLELSDGQFQEFDWLERPSLLNLLNANEDDSTERQNSSDWINIDRLVEDKSSNAKQLTDLTLDTVMRNLPFSDKLTAEFTYLALAEYSKNDKQQQPFEIAKLYSDYRIRYAPDIFMQRAIGHSGWVFVLSSFWFLLSFILLIYFIAVRRLQGEHIEDVYYAIHRSSVCELFTASQQQKLQAGLLEHCGHLHILHGDLTQIAKTLKQCNWNNLAGYLHSPHQHNAILSLSDFYRRDTDGFEVIQQLEKINRQSAHTHSFVLVTDLEDVAFDKSLRETANEFLSQLLSLQNVKVILLSDTCPLFRLIKQHSYPNVDAREFASADEILSWSKLLAEFEKLYLWQSESKTMPIDWSDPERLLEHEGSGWQELTDIKEQFEKSNNKMTVKEWTAEHAVHVFTAHAGALYRKKWERCTREERFMLYQMALGSAPNPQNQEVIEHLWRGGYIYRDAGWHIINESFRRFILHAEKEADIHEWTDEANSGLWSYLRVPIFTLLLVLLIVTVFSSGEALDSALGLVTAVLGLIPLLLRNLALIRGGSASLGE